MKNFDQKSNHPPKWPQKFLGWYCKEELKEELLGDLQERFDQHTDQYGLRKARIRYWLNVCLLMNKYTFKRPQFFPNTSSMLLGNYISMAFRFMRKRPAHTFVNIFGLAIGLTSCLLIFFYLQHEQNFDSFHTNADQIYRVNNFFTRSSGEMRYPLCPPALAPTLQEGFPEIQKTTRLRYDDGHWIGQAENRFFEDNIFFADSNFLHMFSFQWLEGDRHHALNEPNSIVLTKDMAYKYFGEASPLGESLLLDGEKQLKVTGVMENVPSNSHIDFDFLISFQSFAVSRGNLANLESWAWLGFLTYVQTDPQADIPALESKLTQLYLDHNENRANLKVAYKLQPLSDIYLGSSELSNPYGGMFRSGNPLNIYALSIVGLLILFIAGFNFMNLSLAISTTRNREVGVRKILGATKRGLLFRFLSESIIIVMLSLFLGIALMLFIAPILSQYLGWHTIQNYQSVVAFLPILIGCALLIGILTGLYPSIILARFKPLMVLKDQLNMNISGKFLRKGLIGLQFVISISLLISAVVISRQLHFARNQQLGFDKEQLIVSKLSGEDTENQYQTLKQSLLSYPEIVSVSRSSHIFDGGKGSSPMRKFGTPENTAFQVSYYQVDEDFLNNMNIDLLEGRNFSIAFPRDSTASILVNQALVTALELENPIGQKVIFTGGQEKTIIGIIGDFHYMSLHTKIGPFALLMPFTSVENVLIRVAGTNLSGQLDIIEQTFQDVAPEQPFDYHFLDEKIDVLYQKEEKYASLISGFSILAILIASLGLYSLMTFNVHMRMKEIGIRKVLGASSNQILGLLSKQFIWLLLGANIIAWPLSAFVMQKWLSNFAYSIDLHIGIFAGSGLAIMMIAMIALCIQAIPGANSNPANVLRV